MKQCKRKPIYRRVESYFVINYSFTQKGGLYGQGDIRWKVTHPANEEPFIDYGMAEAKIREDVPKISIVVFEVAKTTSEEFFRRNIK
jgi:hypothetical protein